LIFWITAGVVGLAGVVLAVLLVLRHRFNARTVRLWMAVDRQVRKETLTFQPSMVERVPEPARRYLAHALEPGTPLASRVELRGEGDIRIGAELKPFHSLELFAPPRGFVWQADFRSPLVMVDHYLEDEGELSALALWALPRMRARGPDVTRSVRHRLAAGYAWIPDALLPQNGVSWERLDDRRAVAKILIDAEPVDLTMTIAEDGRLEQIELRRWTDRTGSGAWAFGTWVVKILDQGAFHGRIIPTRLSAGFDRDPGESLRMTIAKALFR